MFVSIVLKVGNRTATILALTCLKEEDLESDPIQEAIRNTDGLEILVNLLEIEDRKCKVVLSFSVRLARSALHSNQVLMK